MIALHSAPASFLIIQLVTLACAIATFVHARRDRTAMRTWLAIVSYGVIMEVVSYLFVDNFAHGDFSIVFGGKLPLYIILVYPVLLYTGIAIARRLGLPAIGAGLVIVALDVPYDIVGPRLGWWRWFDGHPEIAVRWQGVPVTSYFWHFSFGAILCALSARWKRTAAVPLIAIATIVLGVAAFLPVHGLEALGLGDGVIVGGAIAAATAWVSFSQRPAPAVERGRDRLLPAIAIAWLGTNILCMVAA